MIPITFRTTDNSRWGTGSAGNLTATQFDLNFWEMKIAVEGLISSPLQPTQIASFSVNGNNMTVHMDDGTTYGPLPMPILVWRWRGNFQAASLYEELDVFQDPATGIYLVLIEHTTGASFDPNAVEIGTGNPLYQQLFGISTIDTSSQLDSSFGSTRGMILYRGATAWLALPAGTPGYILQTNGTAGDPQWVPRDPTRAAVSSAGVTQAAATQLVQDWNVITSGSPGEGVALRVSFAGKAQWIYNATVSDKLVYPQFGDGARINGMAIDAPFTMPAGSSVEFRCFLSQQWYSFP
jgi:hypothetical protein